MKGEIKKVEVRNMKQKKEKQLNKRKARLGSSIELRMKYGDNITMGMVYGQKGRIQY